MEQMPLLWVLVFVICLGLATAKQVPQADNEHLEPLLPGRALKSAGCKPGYTRRNHRCQKCAAGTAKPHYGNGGCSHCTGNTYSAAGATHCHTCPSGRQASAGHTGCVEVHKRTHPSQAVCGDGVKGACADSSECCSIYGYCYNDCAHCCTYYYSGPQDCSGCTASPSPSPTLSPTPSPTPMPSPTPAPVDIPVEPSTGDKERWAWVYFDWATSLEQIQSEATAFTHISPLWYSVNYDYKSGVPNFASCDTGCCDFSCSSGGEDLFGGMTSQEYTAQLTALNLDTVPGIYGGSANQGTDVGIQNILDNVDGAQDNFIAAMVAEAAAKGYAGYNLDFEVDFKVIGDAYSDKFVAFVDAFKARLGPLLLTVDAIPSNIDGTWCSDNNGFLDLQKLGASSIDRVIIEDYTASLGTPSSACRQVSLDHAHPVACPLNSDQSDVTFTGLLDFMCSNLPIEKALIGLISVSTGTNAIGAAAFDAIQAYGFPGVAVFPQAESGSTPYNFLSSQGLASGLDWYALLKTYAFAFGEG